MGGTNQFKDVLKRLVKRRIAIEPVIGHAKYEQAPNRNFLHGRQGDCMNALLAACDFNLHKLLRFFRDSQALASIAG